MRKDFGYTKGCAGCEAKILGTEHRQHTLECRRRIEARMQEDEMLKETLQRRDARISNQQRRKEATMPGQQQKDVTDKATAAQKTVPLGAGSQRPVKGLHPAGILPGSGVSKHSALYSSL